MSPSATHTLSQPGILSAAEQLGWPAALCTHAPLEPELLSILSIPNPHPEHHNPLIPGAVPESTSSSQPQQGSHPGTQPSAPQHFNEVDCKQTLRCGSCEGISSVTARCASPALLAHEADAASQAQVCAGPLTPASSTACPIPATPQAARHKGSVSVSCQCRRTLNKY